MRNEIVLRDVPDSETLARAMEQAGEVLTYRFPDLAGCKLLAERVGEAPPRFAVRLELLLPQQQLILNRAAETAPAALKEALAAACSSPAMARHLRHRLAA
jgi:hypothetical protein